MEPKSPSNRSQHRLAALVLVVLLALLALISVRLGANSSFPGPTFSLGETLRGLLASLGLGEGLEGASTQAIFELRLARTLTAIGVGAALALSGALLQGVFRNDLAAPSIIGVSAGATLGASLAILVLGGYGPLLLLQRISGNAPLWITLAAFAGALSTTALVTGVATIGGRISVPTLLLVGIAVNAGVAGLLAAIQSVFLDDYEVTRALFAWNFGTLTDRAPFQVGMLYLGLLSAVLMIPWVASELDLFAAGEDDARALGVSAGRVKLLALVGASLAAAASVAVAGQIAFVGLVAPHLLRLTVTRAHRPLLLLCLLGGPVLLLSCDVAQRRFLADHALPPGVLMSLLGGPFFLLLLARNRSRVRAW